MPLEPPMLCYFCDLPVDPTAQSFARLEIRGHELVDGRWKLRRDAHWAHYTCLQAARGTEVTATDRVAGGTP